MHSSVEKILHAAAFAGALALSALPADALTVGAQVMSTEAQGVTVKVTLANATPGGPWTFAVVLDTHTQDLSDDLLQTVVLVTDDGREIRPTAWKGGSGGHHREGTLEFPAPTPAPKGVELRMQRPGESRVRSFRWVF